jgi:hypothetical protein
MTHDPTHDAETDAIVAELEEAEPYLVRPTMDDLIRRVARGRGVRAF